MQDDSKPIELLLKAALSDTGPEEEMASGRSCPDEEALASYLEGALPSTDSGRIVEHLSQCANCAEVAILAGLPGEKSQSRRWAMAASLMAWLAGGALAGYFSISLAVAYLGPALVARAGELLLGRPVAASSFSVQLAGGLTLTVGKLDITADDLSRWSANADLARLTISRPPLLRGSVKLAKLLLLHPRVQLRTGRQAGSANPASSRQLLRSFGDQFFTLLQTIPAVELKDGSFGYYSAGTPEKAELLFRNLDARARFEITGKAEFDLRGEVADGGRASLAGSFLEQKERVTQWQASLSLVSLPIPAVAKVLERETLLGLEKGRLSIDGTLEGGIQPAYGFGKLEITNGILQGWAILDLLLRGRRVPTPLRPLSGLGPLPFATLTAAWQYSGGGFSLSAIALEGDNFAIGAELTAAPDGTLKGNGTLTLMHSLAQSAVNLIPSISPAYEPSGRVSLPLTISGGVGSPLVSIEPQ